MTVRRMERSSLVDSPIARCRSALPLLAGVAALLSISFTGSRASA